MLQFLLSVDQELLLLINGLAGNVIVDRLMLVVSSKWVWIPFYACCLYLLINRFGIGNFAWTILPVIAVVVLTDQGSVALFKEYFHRLRPCHHAELREVVKLVSGRCGGQYGFISSHAANVFGLATVLFVLIGRPSPFYLLLFVWATLVSISRIYLGVHYPFDVACGAIFGVAIGLAMGVVVNRAIK